MSDLLDRFPAGVYDLPLIKSAKVVFVGFGSLNAKTAANIAPLPLRKYVFIDPKPFKRSNLQRHILALSDVGKPKVYGGVEWMVEHGVARSRMYAYPTIASDVLQYHQDANLVICGVDVKKVKQELSEWCAARGIPLIISSVFGGGKGGQIIVLPKPQEVCYMCALKALNLLEHTGTPQGTDYGVDPSVLRSPEGDPMAVPSLGAPVGVIAAYTAIKALQIIGKGGEVPSHVTKIALNDWVTMLNINPGPELSAVMQFMESMDALQMQRDWKINSLGHAVAFSVRDSIFTQPISQWSSCPMHSTEVISPDEI